MSDTYDITIRVKCGEPATMACIVHELIMVLQPLPDGTALVVNPRLWAVESISGADGSPVVRNVDELNDHYRSATTLTRDRAYRYIHGKL